ncbi:MAG: aldose epimerase family protein [Luteibacter sp.]|uniref:aldose epimerase family protein n=1 Tax=Luteibacter sp. TaxID=1886636 RepID=UPI0028076E4B|nr:aldose epimerase family protein [Luteibacter sp.]MDQ7994669.1 aldose epimerase family protein [Luteibacter sp.]MDQ8048242.1 aldose epimerase family protein [Luteibacter sp.]
MPVSNATAWGHLPDGRPLHRWTLRNARDAQIDITDLGGTLLSWQAPDRQGRVGDILLGHADAQQYLASTAYMGAIVGRWANRIRGGRFSVDGIDYRVDRNDGGNHLHGGHDGFHLQRWDVEPDGDALLLRLVSPEGDGGFPGEVRVTLRVQLEDDGSLDLRYEAESDAPTPLSLTAHPYFNLNDRRPDIRDHVIRIDADEFLAIDAGAIPVGRQHVAGTAFDFREPAPIGSRLHWPDPQLQLVGGFDHCYIPHARPSEAGRVVAVVSEPSSGRRLTVRTDRPGLQFYSGQKLAGQPGRHGDAYGPFAGFALEAQAFPDQVNGSEAEGAILRPGVIWRQHTRYTVDTD